MSYGIQDGSAAVSAASLRDKDRASKYIEIRERNYSRGATLLYLAATLYSTQLKVSSQLVYALFYQE